MERIFAAVDAAVGTSIPRGSGVLAACSGGADSVALAAALARAEVRCSIGHVDHGLREESRREAEQVRELARTLAVPFFTERLEGLQTRGQGLEAAAREGRYGALVRLARQAGCPLVATAHTRRDQAETLLMRLIRGAGPGALAGVRQARELAPGLRLVRPLLEVSREDTEAFCAAHRLPYFNDPHNVDPARTRARIRALWPLLRELNPRLEEALSGAAATLAEEDALLQSLALEGALNELPLPLLRRRLLHDANAAGLRPEREHLETLCRLLRRGKGIVDVPGGRAEVVDGAVRYTPGSARVAESPGPPPAFSSGRPEMDAAAGRLSPLRQGDLRSATMLPANDEESR